MNIVKVLIPNAYKLKKDKEGNYTSVIVDEELDPFPVDLIGENCIQINTDEMAYITLSIDTLYQIIELIEKAELKYAKQSNE